MTVKEFSDQFDVLYNNIMSNQAPGLDEYEKSVFLTKAQDEILKNYFNPKGNKYQEGFDGSQKRQIDFSKLMCTSYSSGAVLSDTSFFKKTKGAYSVKWPTDNGIFLVINEVVDVVDSISKYIKRLQVVPIKFDEYQRVCSKPYKQPLKNQAWRIISNSDEVVIIVGHNNNVEDSGYHIRYLKHPNPIILEDLSGTGLSINNKTSVASCELDEEIHWEILQRAVELAKVAYTGDMQSITQTGLRSE